MPTKARPMDKLPSKRNDVKPGRWVAAVSWIAVACAGGAPVVPPPGPSVTRLTVSGARNGQPFFSPDGGRIGFVSDRERGWQVWTMPASGGDDRRLTDEDGPVGWPSWSVEGDAILFYGRRDGRYR